MGQGRELTIVQNLLSIPKAYCLLPCRKRNLRNYMCKKCAGRHRRTEQMSKDRTTVFLQSHSLLPMENFCLHTNRQGRPKKQTIQPDEWPVSMAITLRETAFPAWLSHLRRKPHRPWKQSCFTHSQKYKYDKWINQEAGRFNGLELFLLIYSNFLCVKISMHEQLLISNIKTNRFFFVCVFI